MLKFSPQAIIKKLEKTVNQLIEESTQAAAASDYETVREFSVTFPLHLVL